jgi:hypothetical protein
MSINHLIDSATNPRYDIYVKDIEASNDVVVGNNVIVSAGLTAPFISATNRLNIALQNNYNDILSNVPFASGSFLFDQGFNGFTNLSNIWQYVSSREVSVSGIVDTYKLTWSGETQAVTVDAIFDFRALYAYTDIIDVKASAQWELSAGINDVGVEIRAPQDPANDFEIEINTDNTAQPAAGRVIFFSVEIQLHRFSPL